MFCWIINFRDVDEVLTPSCMQSCVFSLQLMESEDFHNYQLSKEVQRNNPVWLKKYCLRAIQILKLRRDDTT